MVIKLNLVLVFAVLVVGITLVECRNIFDKQYSNQETEVEFVTRGPKGKGTNIFKDWMKLIQDFFEEGNWSEGGPRNFAKFIGNQVSKLVELLTGDDGIFSKK